ncbi:MAG: hypothetical protein ABSA92_15965 [Candidatus Bathyarchaeia archaeon]|jgi:hypothetical protein
MANRSDGSVRPWHSPPDEKNYEDVIRFYDAVRKEIYGELERLQDYDYETQSGVKIRNTWIRVIDKWLWLKGMHQVRVTGTS